jgi:glycosyltransferase involved in cell wall biosynthesis
VRLAFILAERFAASRTHRILSVGSEIRDKYLDHGIGVHGQYEIVRTGLDLSPFMEPETEAGAKARAIKQELGIPAEAALILSVGRLDPSKGFEYAIQVVAGLKARNIDAHLLIAGDGLHAGFLEKTALNLDIGERLHLLGFRSDVHHLMQACDIFLFTSIREGLPQVLVQAAASGMPIITHAVEGAREVIEDGETGYVITSGDTEAALERAIFILDNPESANAMAERARNAVQDQWSPIRMIAHTDAIYQDLLANWRNIK